MICISVTPESRTFAKVDMLNAARQCDLVELCLDRLIKEPDVGDMLEGIDKPILISCRRRKDGGQFDGTEEERMTLLRQAIVANPAYIELDYEIAQAIPRFGDVKRVLSYTSLRTPYNKQDIDEIFTEAKQLNADIVKFTWPTPTLEAAWPLLAAVSTKHDIPAVGLGLGRAGMTFSLLGRKYGSPWIYAALEKGMEAFEDQATVTELDDIYGWRDINSNTNFIGIVGMGGSETVTSQAFNAVFRVLRVNARCLPLMSEKFDKLKTMLDALKIQAVVTSRDLGGELVSLADDVEESAKISQFADLLLNKGKGWQAYNTIWRSAVRQLEATITSSGNDKRPLDKQNVMVIGSGSLARALVYGISKRKGLVSVTSPDDKQSEALATEFDVRFVPFQHLYNTLSDVVVIAEPGLPVGSSKTEFNPTYLVSRMTVCDVTEMPNDSVYIKEARDRGAKVVEPKLVYLDQIAAFIKSITGKDVAPSEFEKFVTTAVEEGA